MKSEIPVVILCGGKGTRLGSDGLPKALIEIGERPILWHIMKLYAHQGFSRFILCLGWGGDQIREAFDDRPGGLVEPGWDVQFIDTGLETPKAGRILRVSHLLEGTFMATYGDGVARIDLRSLLDHHRKQGRLATITCARAALPFGLVEMEQDGSVMGFVEKPRIEEWINGGFFVFEREVLSYLSEDVELEQEPFEKLAADREMTAFRLEEFWACMDTYKEALMLNTLWEEGAPWRTWDEDVKSNTQDRSRMSP